MTKVEELKQIIASIEPLNPSFVGKVNEDGSFFELSPKYHRAKVGQPYTDLKQLALDCLIEHFDSTRLKYTINQADSFHSCVQRIRSEMLKIAEWVSPAKRPHQTQLFKKVNRLCKYDSNEEVTNHLIGLYAYYLTNREQIRTDSNCVHGRNILGLLTNITSKY